MRRLGAGTLTPTLSLSPALSLTFTQAIPLTPTLALTSPSPYTLTDESCVAWAQAPSRPPTHHATFALALTRHPHSPPSLFTLTPRPHPHPTPSPKPEPNPSPSPLPLSRRVSARRTPS